MKCKFIPLFLLLLFSLTAAQAQQQLVYNHYFINPALYNPSFIAPDGYSALYLNYRKQWSGIKGAPTTGTLNLHLPLNHKAGIALTAYQDEAGLLTTSSGMISFAYQVYFGKRITDLNKLSFGLAAGVTNSRIKADEATDINDPVVANNTSSLDGQVGIHYQYNKLKIAFAIPRIFEGYTASEKSFNSKGIAQINNTLSSVSYNFSLSHRFSFEPFFVYRTFENQDPQFEALGSFKIDQLLWFGGSYRQDYGAAAFFGLNIKEKIRVGYAYEFATDQSDKMGDGSHEVQLILRLGKKQFSRPQIVEQEPANSAPAAVAQANALKEELKTEQEEGVLEIPKDDAVAQPDLVEVQSEQSVVEESHQIQAETVEADAPQPTVADLQEEPAEIDLTQKTEVTKLNGEGLASGHYVVVGAFASVENAKKYSATLKRSGYPASVAYHPEKGYYIVHMINAPTIEEARGLRDMYRRMSRYSFRDTWILSID